MVDSKVITQLGLAIGFFFGSMTAIIPYLHNIAQAQTLQGTKTYLEVSQSSNLSNRNSGFNPSLGDGKPDNTISVGSRFFIPPPGHGKPDNTGHAGSRNEKRCSADSLPSSGFLTALVLPDSVGLTSSERPVFWVYLPPTTAKQVILVIRNEDETHHSQTIIPISGEGGIIGLTIGKDASPLEVGKRYQWDAVLVCGEKPHPNDPVVTDWVERVNLSQSPSFSSPLDMATQYGKQGIWYDMLTYLVQATIEQPSNEKIGIMWKDLLNYAGLGSISTEKINHIFRED